MKPFPHERRLRASIFATQAHPVCTLAHRLDTKSKIWQTLAQQSLGRATRVSVCKARGE